MRDLASAARGVFERAAPGIPCASIMRPGRGTGQGGAEPGIAAIFKEADMTEIEHA